MNTNKSANGHDLLACLLLDYQETAIAAHEADHEGREADARYTFGRACGLAQALHLFGLQWSETGGRIYAVYETGHEGDTTRPDLERLCKNALAAQIAA